MSQAPTTKGSRSPHVDEGKEKDQSEQMCCDGKRTAAEHRKESADGKCCSDS